MSELEQAVIDRRIKFLEEEARLNKAFRDYAIKRFAEWPEGKTASTKEHPVPETAPNRQLREGCFTGKT